jgi:cell division protein FtsB
MLRELLAQTELLTPTEVSLATVFLSSVEQQIVTNSEARRLRASTSRAAQTREDAVNQRIATVEDENRRLKRELQDAQDKLDAITSIERSIREQEP